MGRNDLGQLGREQQSVPELPYNVPGDSYDNSQQNIDNAQAAVSAPQMIFTLLNTKVTDIQCGSYHNVAIGTPRSSTAAMTVG